MFLSVRHKPMKAMANRCDVFHKDLGVRIPRVVWANDKTGRYRQHLVDEKGKVIIEGDHIKSKIFTGNIEIRKVR